MIDEAESVTQWLLIAGAPQKIYCVDFKIRALVS